MKISHILLIINVALALIFCQGTVFAQSSYTIVLDAGHGGKDPGTVKGKVYEKDINLAVAKVVGNNLEKNPNFKVVYTRTDDTFVELNERSDIAIKNKADLFVSLHVNAIKSTNAYGVETYVMGTHKNEANLEVAQRENGVISLEDNFSSSYEGYDPMSSESHIMFSLMQYAHSQESLELAFMVQSACKGAGRRDRGVKQAGFLVLWRNTMPSILVELGFLSNPSELTYMNSAKGQRELGEAIASSIESYYLKTNRDIEIASTTPSPQSQTTPQEQLPPTPPAHFEVQVKASKTKLQINKENFGPLVMQIKERNARNTYKYTIGKLFLYSEALNLQRQIKNYTKGAFVVAFDEYDNQISVAEAKNLLEN